ncbi:hypothetical protein KC660_04345 [Candidatus Dojkabacteria bacterium]|uniref:Uncharacterized protein n=1 Tax=Candidatus Dojkabacteria bacterium TaxID=2099670 RepID=A0A955L4B6_9BACT|nr:hypothetical protein [Candidatus Dojkabacteria bacterium]
MNNLTNKIIVALRLNSKEAKLSQNEKNDMFTRIVADYDLESKNDKKKKFHFPFKGLAIAFAVILVIVGIGFIPIFPNNKFPNQEQLNGSSGNSANQIQLIQQVKAGSVGDTIKDDFFVDAPWGTYSNQRMKITEIGTKGCGLEGEGQLLGRYGYYVNAQKYPETIVDDLESAYYFDSDGTTNYMIGKDSRGDLEYLYYSDGQDFYEYFGGNYIAHIVTPPEEMKKSAEARKEFVDFYNNEKSKKTSLVEIGSEYLMDRINHYQQDEQELIDPPIIIEAVEGGYISTETSEFGCLNGESSTNRFHFDQNGNVQSLESYVGAIKEENLIYRADFLQESEPSDYYEVLSKFGPEQVKEFGIEIKDFSSYNPKGGNGNGGNASDAALVKAVFEKNPLPALIPTSPAYRVDQLYFASKYTSLLVNPHRPYYSDVNFFASEIDFDAYAHYTSEDYAINDPDFLQADLMVTALRRDESYNYHGFVIYMVSKAVDKEDLGRVMIEQALNPVKIGEIELSVDGKQVVFDKFEGTDNYTGAKKTYLSADITDNYYVVISDLAEKETYEDVAKLKFELKDTTKPEDLKYMIDLGEEIY